MNKDPTPAARFDPMKAWREWFTQSERDWSEGLTRLMKDDATARALGQEINAALYASQMVKEGMAGSMAMMNVPTQDQLVALSERLGSLEDAVARVEANLVQLRHSLDATASAKPTRGRKLPSPAVAQPSASETTAVRTKPARKRRA
ncbi:hypothetical protein [Piscinibacter sp. XHJ-5]|uniref:hypothetical protein n=1 Tax=Piscinibacter sp. XHJ-5 TaxID=3037797 RepID=UPI002452F62C|nr:hypothetical protein [Piscinibacter sp. XHJ-5]